MRALTLILLLCIVGYCSAATNYNIYFEAFNCVNQTGCPAINNRFKFTSTINWPDSQNPLIAPSLTLSVGDMITFTRNRTSTVHPFVVCTNSDSTLMCHNSPPLNNLTFPITNAGNTVTWTAPAVGTYWYGCTRHDGMGGKITVVATGAGNTDESICTYYARALNGGSADANQQTDTIMKIVDRAVNGNTTVTVPAVKGIFTVGGPTRRFFDGSFPCIFDGTTTPATINFFQDTTASNALGARLIGFFGTALGCNAPGFVTASNPSLRIRGSMWQVHQYMGINDNEMQYFIKQIVDSVKSYTGTALRTGDDVTLSNFLNGFNKDATASAVNGMGLTPGNYNNGATEQICDDANCRSVNPGHASAASAPMFLLTIILVLVAMIRF